MFASAGAYNARVSTGLTYGSSHLLQSRSNMMQPLPPVLPVRFRRDPADLARIDPERGTARAKHPKAYYLDGLTAVFQPDVSLPGTLRVDQKFSGAEVALLSPGSSAVEVLWILDRFPEIKCLHVIESHEKNIDGIRSELQ